MYQHQLIDTIADQNILSFNTNIIIKRLVTAIIGECTRRQDTFRSVTVTSKGLLIPRLWNYSHHDKE